MARHILMVGKSASIRRNLESDLLAMYDDVVLSEVNTVPQVELSLANSSIHLVIYVMDADDQEGLHYCADISSADPEIMPPCLVLACDRVTAGEAKGHGIKNVLMMPYSADKLADIINRICNPVGLRQSKRYSIPKTTAIIKQRDLQMKAVVLNVSSGGVLCEFTPVYTFRIVDPVMLTLQFLNKNSALAASKIYAISSNMKVVERNDDYTPRKIRVGYKFITVSPDTLAALNIIFQEVDT